MQHSLKEWVVFVWRRSLYLICLMPCCLWFLLLVRHGGHSPPAGQCGNPAVPWLWHDRRCNLLHKWRGVGRDAIESRGSCKRRSGTRWCPRRMESFKGENRLLHSCIYLQMTYLLLFFKCNVRIQMLVDVCPCVNLTYTCLFFLLLTVNQLVK